MSSKIICYELNEVPWRVVDFYTSQRPKSNLLSFLSQSSHLRTLTSDDGELHPWSTWPTMHRGVDNTVHNIRYINQDRSSASDYPPLWEILSQAGKSVGVCGTLQSYPPLDGEGVLFHVPDTFAPAPDTKPSKYEPFQELNLKLTSENKAVASKIHPLMFLKASKMFFAGVKLRTAFKVLIHLVKERINPLYKSRRATMQSHLAFDVFMDCLKHDKPDFTSFFTNHVAGIMHRYWKYSFPEDFGYSLNDSAKDQFHKSSILDAMDIFDAQLGVLVKYCKKNDYDLIVASSMGQEAVVKQSRPELKLSDHIKLAQTIGFTKPFEMRLAMQPDVAFEFETSEGMNEFIALTSEILDGEGAQVLPVRYEPKGLSLNISVAASQVAIETDKLFFRGEECALKDFGLEGILRDVGTGYHQPEGILIWSGKTKPKLSERNQIKSQQFAPTILESLGVKKPEYMPSPVL